MNATHGVVQCSGGTALVYRCRLQHASEAPLLLWETLAADLAAAQARLTLAQSDLEAEKGRASFYVKERNTLVVRLAEMAQRRNETVAMCAQLKSENDAFRARCEAMWEALVRIKDETLLGRSHELGTRIYDICNTTLAAQELK